ncbi:MAG: thioredoxin domain-containing protein [Haloferacaceae archaeon]
MTDPTGRNRLDEEASPYLRQHADNPVNWQPWDEAALRAARERDVPIFLSIGYSACHWCHVMEEESFQDGEVARLLNEEFVPIKVDREERPDVDSVYMTVCQLVTGRGGWPLSAWLTPDGRPFYVGTYFPKESRQGTPGFRSLLENLAESWETDREKLEERADEWTAAVADRLEETPDAPGEPPDAETLTAAADAVLRSADREYGGFGTSGPKFPQPSRIDLLLRTYAVTGREAALDVAVETLDAMAAGGVYDHVGGGFHRYATDREWTVPHFEKMLYDNAELPRVYLAAHRLTGAPRFATVAQETLGFVERELRHPDGGFYSTLDARSEPPAGRSADGEEGAYYVWTPSEVEAAVDDDLTATLVTERYGITPGGNFEGGTTVPTVSASYAALAERHDLDEAAVGERLLDGRAALFAARERRPRPRRDEKVLAGWNGLMVSAFADAARTLDPALADRAVDALAFVREHLWDADAGRLRRRYKDGDVQVDGYLEDYAFLARGALDTYQATGDVDALAFALDLARAVVANFWDEDAGTLYFTPADGEGLVTRPQELSDQSTPSSLGVATNLLLDLDAFAPDAGFGDVAERVLGTHGDRVRASPTEHVTLALAADRLARGGVELTVAADELPPAWREALADRYLPTAVLARRPPTAAGLADWLDRLGLDEAPPVWRGREARDGEPTVYACRGRTCSPPEHDLTAALDWLGESGDGSDGK